MPEYERFIGVENETGNCDFYSVIKLWFKDEWRPGTIAHYKDKELAKEAFRNSISLFLSKGFDFDRKWMGENTQGNVHIYDSDGLELNIHLKETRFQKDATTCLF